MYIVMSAELIELIILEILACGVPLQLSDDSEIDDIAKLHQEVIAAATFFNQGILFLFSPF